MPSVLVKGQFKKKSVAKKYVKSLEIESRIYLTGSKKFLCMYMVSLLGNKTSTGHVHAIDFQTNILIVAMP